MPGRTVSRDPPASPQMVFNVVLSLGVHNDSEKAIANLGYYNVQFLRPVYPGDTLRVIPRSWTARPGEDKPRYRADSAPWA